jgi:hypothetical protein
VKGIV